VTAGLPPLIPAGSVPFDRFLAFAVGIAPATSVQEATLRRLIAAGGLLAAILLAAAPASACPATRDAQSEPGCEVIDPGREVPVPVPGPAPAEDQDPGRDPGPRPVEGPAPGDVPDPAPAPVPGPVVAPAVEDGTQDGTGAGTGAGTGTVGTTDDLPFTGPRTVTLVIVAAVLATIGAGSLLTSRYQARH
jgi:hypothetical protein